ncbi:unnamed protein product [Parnassius apollo]|uniref:(apollo) hypothetical protein n=1 Tax=Parnassius apollo TaxID=110799 RepID=A0A8S3Y9A4_PARAO|nr:unnamed protein product [Parnassius apollo]
MHRLFAALEPSLTVTEQNLADRVRYILRSNIFDVAELERLRREAVPSSDENDTAEDAAPQIVEQPAKVDATVNIPVVVDSNDDGTVAQELELEHMNVLHIGRGDCGNAQYASRKSTASSPHSRLCGETQAEPGCREGSEPNAGDLFGSQPGPLRDRLNSFWRRAGSLPYHKRQGFHGWTHYWPKSGNNRPRIKRTVRMAFAGTNVSLSQPDITQKLTEHIDDLKQRIAAWGKRIRRYTERSTRFNQNSLFQSDQKRLYESLQRPSGTGPALNQADTVAFWRGLWSELVNRSEAPWTEVVASQCASLTPMDPVIITPNDVAEAVWNPELEKIRDSMGCITTG